MKHGEIIEKRREKVLALARTWYAIPLAATVIVLAVVSAVIGYNYNNEAWVVVSILTAEAMTVFASMLVWVRLYGFPPGNNVGESEER